EDTIRRADHVIDIGPGAGRLGGRIVACGPHETLARQPDSVTGRFLAQPLAHPLGAPRPTGPGLPGLEWMTLRNAHLHNLAAVDVRLPLGRLTVVTGVSGSGKSTLARDLLLRGVAAQVHARNRREPAPRIAGLAAIENWEGVSR